MRTAAAIRIATIRSNAGAQTHPRRTEKSRGLSWSDIAGHHSVGAFVERSLRQPGLPRTSQFVLQSWSADGSRMRKERRRVGDHIDAAPHAGLA